MPADMGSKAAPKAATIRVMGAAAEVEVAVARLVAVGFQETGRAPMRGDPDGLRVYGVLAGDGDLVNGDR